MLNLLPIFFLSIFTCVDPDSEYGYGSTKILNTDPDPQHCSIFTCVDPDSYSEYGPRTTNLLKTDPNPDPHPQHWLLLWLRTCCCRWVWVTVCGPCRSVPPPAWLWWARLPSEGSRHSGTYIVHKDAYSKGSRCRNYIIFLQTGIKCR